MISENYAWTSRSKGPDSDNKHGKFLSALKHKLIRESTHPFPRWRVLQWEHLGIKKVWSNVRTLRWQRSPMVHWLLGHRLYFYHCWLQWSTEICPEGCSFGTSEHDGFRGRITEKSSVDLMGLPNCFCFPLVI